MSRNTPLVTKSMKLDSFKPAAARENVPGGALGMSLEEEVSLGPHAFEEGWRKKEWWGSGYLGFRVQFYPCAIRHKAQNLPVYVEMSEFCWDHCDLVAGGQIFVSS